MTPLEQIKNEFKAKWISEWVVDDGNNKLLWNDKAPTPNEVITFISQKLLETEKRVASVTGETSDGYHTFNELYRFRLLYNACLFNEWAKQDKFKVHKSKKHADAELCFGGGWFVVVAYLPISGGYKQISNHYELKDWDLFQCVEREYADVWDGHTPQDVAVRLEQFINQLDIQKEENVHK